MAHILAFSSYVASGHVGLTAVVPALQRLGHEVIALPSVVLSNHLGHPHWAGRPVAVEDLSLMLGALERNGQLDGLDAILTGFLPSSAHVALAAKTVLHVRDRIGDAIFLCDPVLGDEPEGLYIEPLAAQAVARDLTPLATYLTPNKFEAEFIFGGAHGAGPGIPATAAALPPSCRMLTVTSAELRENRLTSRCLTRAFSCACEVPYRLEVAHGTGDLFAALLLGHILNGISEREAFGRAVAGVEVAIAMSEGCDELALVASLQAVAEAEAWATCPV